ncbi:sigma-70 family RNA polymerase sigma factor [Desulfuromonas carbonis]|uniref:RNA polymerase sigma factor n=1 Tax=Desulfuromonas sp. DDH964 TaxID=1823759 RepID=UPI00078D61D4|nr:sigma-70 family RNA polymerase sigma factor [Desulfuromonas sp. DDH964]AMV70576.1 RNA polymerase sigma factor CarQ [Desulfuromonas sp. DDH964]
MTDEELMQAYARGEQAAFDQLYARHKCRVMGYLLKRSGDRTAAEDVFQAVFLKLHRSRDNYRDELPFLPWLFTIVRTALIDAARREQTRSARIVLDGEQVAAAVADHVPDPAPLHEALPALATLSPDQRRVLELRFGQGFSFTEIAEQLELSPANARKLASRALGRLRRLLGGKEMTHDPS